MNVIHHNERFVHIVHPQHQAVKALFFGLVIPSGGKFAQARFSEEAYACRGLDHLVKRGVQEVQGPVKSALFEVAFPHEEGEALRCLPRVLIELVGASE